MYKLTSTSIIIRIADNAAIPDDLENADRQQYLAWVAEGNIPAPPDLVSLVPTSISSAQGQLALIEYGKYQAAVNFINAIPDPVEKLKAEVNFYRRNDWQRDNQTLLALAQGLGITDQELDQMFIFGATQ